MKIIKTSNNVTEIKKNAKMKSSNILLQLSLHVKFSGILLKNGLLLKKIVFSNNKNSILKMGLTWFQHILFPKYDNHTYIDDIHTNDRIRTEA